MRSFKTLTTFLFIAFLFARCCKTEEISNRDSDNEVPQTEPYTFYVRNLDEVRQNGKIVEDFYITNIGNSWDLYYINAEGQLFGYRSKEKDTEDNSVQLIAENIVHIDCGGMMDYTVFLTADGELYSMGYSKSGVLLIEGEKYRGTPLLLMEGVKYALCGYGDIVVLKDDNSVWTWGSNFYDMCGVPRQGVIGESACMAQGVTMIWMGKLQINAGCLKREKWHHYGYDAGYTDNLVIKRMTEAYGPVEKMLKVLKRAKCRMELYTHMISCLVKSSRHHILNMMELILINLFWKNMTGQ